MQRVDLFFFFFSPSDTFVKPNLWLLVNPNIVCPVRYVQTDADLQPEPGHADQLLQLEPGDAEGPSTSDPQTCPHQEELMLSASSTEKHTVTNSHITVWENHLKKLKNWD